MPPPIDQNGNVLFLILIAVVLFAALSYSVTQSSRGVGNIDSERAILEQATLENCTSNVEYAILKISTLNGCDTDQISYENSKGDNANTNAPADKSCHIFDKSGGGAYECGPYLEAGCIPAITNPGDRCGSLVYAAEYGGEKLLTTAADSPVKRFKYAGSGSTAASSTTNGTNNTNVLVALAVDYDAAETCRLLGPDWYLPSRDELLAVMANKTAIGGFSALGTGGHYWTSTEASASTAYTVSHQTGAAATYSKNSGWNVRCVRKEP